MSHRAALVAASVLLAAMSLGLSGFSGATFTAQSRNAATISAAADWTPPSVAVVDPGATVSGTVTVSAAADDATSGIASVSIGFATSPTGPWTTLCTATSTPYQCSWDTTLVGDGGYLLRASATDRAGNSAVSTTVATAVLNTARVTLTGPGDVVRGSVPVAATVDSTGGAAVSLSLQYRLSDSTGAWSTLCASSTKTTLTCTWDTRTVVSDSYDLRAVAVVAGKTYTDVVTDVLVDNVAPTVTMLNPGSPLRGTVTLAATAVDDESDIATVEIRYAAAGSSTYTSACTTSTTPYSCRFNTTGLKDGDYDLLAVATDNAGNTTTSNVVRKVTVNNSVASVSVEDPGAFVSGTVAVNASAFSTNGVSRVSIQRAPAGGGTFTEICADTTAPYSCDWDTTAVADGKHTLRAVLTDGRGVVTTSSLITVTVDNSELRALDVQAVNSGTAVGRLDAGDQVVLSYSSLVSLPTLLAGWDGSPRAVTVTVRDGKLVGSTNANDQLSVNGVNLGAVELRGNYVKKNKIVTFPSSITATSVTVDGMVRSVVTVTLGTPSSSGLLATATAPAAMVWTPSALVRTTGGKACSLTPATELGPNDRDF